MESAKYGKLSLASSDNALVESFEWAKKQALAYVFDGDPVGKWYEAALPGRAAFCMRDVSHQALGAHALGLQAWNLNMLRKFAANISESKDWCTFWEINKYDLPAPVDYRNDKEFWYNLPSNFDVLDCCWRMFLWAGDKTYIEDPVFLNFYERTIDDFVERWDLDLDKVMSRLRFMNRETFNPDDSFHVCRGIPSYHEENPGEIRLGVDLLVFQFAAYRAYAQIMSLKADPGKAEKFLKKAEEIKDFINQRFWDEKNNEFNTLYRTDGSFIESGGLQAFLLYKDATEPGDKTNRALRYLIEKTPVNIEMKSYYPEILYRYGAPDKASKMILELCDSQTRRREYPEVSFTAVGTLVSGLMGIEPDAREGSIKTLSRLSGEIAWAEMDFLPVFKNTVKVRHNGQQETILTNRSGNELQWIACFYAEGDELLVNGKEEPADRYTDRLGNSILSARVIVKSWETISIKTK